MGSVEFDYLVQQMIDRYLVSPTDPDGVVIIDSVQSRVNETLEAWERINFEKEIKEYRYCLLHYGILSLGDLVHLRGEIFRNKGNLLTPKTFERINEGEVPGIKNIKSDKYIYVPVNETEKEIYDAIVQNKITKTLETIMETRCH